MKSLQSQCYYGVIDVATGEMLITGRKVKDFSRMKCDCAIRCFPQFWKKSYFYSRFANVGGRTCYVEYITEFATKKSKPAKSVVWQDGIKYRLRGSVRESIKRNNMRRYLDAIGVPGAIEGE